MNTLAAPLELAKVTSTGYNSRGHIEILILIWSSQAGLEPALTELGSPAFYLKDTEVVTDALTDLNYWLLQISTLS